MAHVCVNWWERWLSNVCWRMGRRARGFRNGTLTRRPQSNSNNILPLFPLTPPPHTSHTNSHVHHSTAPINYKYLLSSLSYIGTRRPITVFDPLFPWVVGRAGGYMCRKIGLVCISKRAVLCEIGVQWVVLGCDCLNARYWTGKAKCGMLDVDSP